MIGKLKGKLSETSGNVGLIETSGGVFYEVFLTPSLLSTFHLPPLSSTIHYLPSIEVYTYLQVRDDALVLFGFQTKRELDFFKLLLTVPGVGPKTAFSVISFLPLDLLVSSVQANDVDSFTRIPGLGRKTAMKIILELSTKLKSEFDMTKMVLSEEDKTVIDALVSLGYKSFEAKKLLSKLPKNLNIEEKIKEALKTKFL
ncbi:Holliday junction branch migration protein RuvA [Candidatus Roizmanbacteria bacterium CG22_combo_CG10-13_8_21_14_all_35_9]|uniref:Holliday junction branch migration complex subunit RuvA n=4 Tax=Candidatus Roizmaniibacteriota TaxID=1752723 RepID=A0A2M8F254_9BACT|nr:MAG: Holliday junction branch migration protein RuvA [Candidatus Roizmanbacteria bacterium CG23_combo_of_CG06-09_8_20_14_all_35_49]PIP62584.1 MAG: Holliday junction branch migration protein RuvA [Candidatus Roizmanbacteria bacterium CG22_combo_CG10-13_8_21_14_all_35_9]PIY71079.1 MAG: Holliday junction branch migration protein RuvA [Candidatus Roizmanbacteria bacterium CG_4_10_14_0_8_um_filter_35_28]PJC33357.1 MAG: Holliday junction branch migration protein RuvA [Candidatus Roizmanbacteria bac